MGGGTVVMAQINEGRLFPLKAMSLRRAGMDELRVADGQIQIGAATTVARISRIEELPILAQAANMLGGPALRTMATIGGNMFMPAPYADLAVPLLALDAQVELAGPGGSRDAGARPVLQRIRPQPLRRRRAADWLQRAAPGRAQAPTCALADAWPLPRRLWRWPCA